MISGTGRTGTYRTRIKTGDTASALGNPGITVLATPVLAGFCEKAAFAACEAVASGSTRRMRISIRHLAPTPVGDEVVINAEVTEVNDHRMRVSVSGRDSRHDIVSGWIERVRIG